MAHRLEDEADHLLRNLLERPFPPERDPIGVLKRRNLYQRLEVRYVPDA